MDKNPLSRLETAVILWGDNALQARATSVMIVNMLTHEKFFNIMEVTFDRVIIFSWWKITKKNNCSEAREMYNIFIKRLKVLNASGLIKWWIQFPENSEQLNHWDIRIGDKKVTIYIEEDSVDMEDNAKNSAKIVWEIFNNWIYDKLVVSPLSSKFQKERTNETFNRHIPKWSNIDPLDPWSAETILKKVTNIAIANRYKKYWKLKEEAVWPKAKCVEVILRLASRFEWGRKKIRELSQKNIFE